MRFEILAGATLCAALLGVLPAGCSQPSAHSAPTLQSADMFVFFGTGGNGPGHGIFMSYFDSKTGALSTPTLDVQADSPSFFAIADDSKHLYAVNSIANFDGQQHMGALSSFSLDPHTGKLAFINQKPSMGEDPCYISLDKTGKFAFVANYTGNGVPGEGGNYCAYAIKPDGSLGERTAFIQHKGTSIDPLRQKAAYGHSIFVDPTNKFALACDLGLDRVYIYKFDANTGSLTPNNPEFVSVKPGSGPRHGTFSPNGKFFYTTHEMGGIVTAFTWDSGRGVLTPIQEISTLPAGFTGLKWNAEVRVTPDGKYLYASNRTDDSITQFSIDPATGKLTWLDNVKSGGKTPRNFMWDPTGHWFIVSNQEGHNSVLFRRDPVTGKLTKDLEVPIEVPFCTRFLVKQ